MLGDAISQHLVRKKCRDQLCAIAHDFEEVFARLLRHRGRTSLSPEEFTRLGNSMMGRICIAIHANEERFMRNYHAMDATRCFQACLQYGLGLKAFSYTAIVHDWTLKKQAKKFRDVLVEDMYYFEMQTHEDVAKEIDWLSSRVSGTITFATFFAHLCEVRQCINRFGLRGTAFLVHLYHSVKACKTSAHRVIKAMKDGTWTKVGCFAVMVLDEIRQAKKLTIQNVLKSRFRGTSEKPWNVVRSMRDLSPKLCLEGIPEWVAMRNNLDLLICKCMNSYNNLCNAAKNLSIDVLYSVSLASKFPAGVSLTPKLFSKPS